MKKKNSNSKCGLFFGIFDQKCQNSSNFKNYTYDMWHILCLGIFGQKSENFPI